MSQKISIRFYNDREVRAVWSEVVSATTQLKLLGYDTLDGQSRKKAYALYESNLLDSIEVGTVKGLQQIHAYDYSYYYEQEN